MLDALQAGRANVRCSKQLLTYIRADIHVMSSEQTLSVLGNNASNATHGYNRLDGLGGLYFRGPTRGVLPNGPNGIPAFNTLAASSFSDAISDSSLPYNYTLELQGISTNLTCVYETDSPIIYSDAAPNLWQFTGTCPPGQDFLWPNMYVVSPSNHTLGFWACQTTPLGDSFNLYLRGTNLYSTDIGNVTCTISPIRPAVFLLTFISQDGTFTTQGPISTSPGTSTELLKSAVNGVGDIIWKAQSLMSNMVADMMVGLALEFFELPPDSQDENYLRLYEAVIQGMLDYEVRLIDILVHPHSLQLIFASITGHIYPLDLLGKHLCGTTVLHTFSQRLRGFPIVCLACHE